MKKLALYFAACFLTLPSLQAWETIQSGEKLVFKMQTVTVFPTVGNMSLPLEIPMSVPVLCSACLAENQRHCLKEGLSISSSTMMEFASPTGTVHRHKTIVTKTVVFCDVGHWKIVAQRKGSCPCGWDASSDIKASDGVNLSDIHAELSSIPK